MEVLVEKVPDLYVCNPSWPICLFDFSYRNLNPKFLTYKVRADLTSFVIPNFFDTQKLRMDPGSQQQDATSQQLAE